MKIEMDGIDVAESAELETRYLDQIGIDDVQDPNAKRHPSCVYSCQR
jgi:hypothetical protein